MPTLQPRSHPRRERNHLLASLSADEYQHIAPYLQPVAFESHEVIYAAGEPIKSIYFPLSTIVSLLAVTKQGDEVEVGLIGNEGLIGLSVFWGVAYTPHEAIVVLEGDAVKTSATALKMMIESRQGHLHDLLLRYTHALVAHISQTAACNRLHDMTARLARWLLVSHDRAAVREFPLTHDFLAQLLGVRRSGITEAVARLREKKLIEYGRELIAIADRSGLEAESCECYEIVRQSLDYFLNTAAPCSPQPDALTRSQFAGAGEAVTGTIGTALPGYRKPARRTNQG